MSPRRSIRLKQMQLEGGGMRNGEYAVYVDAYVGIRTRVESLDVKIAIFQRFNVLKDCD